MPMRRVLPYQLPSGSKAGLSVKVRQPQWQIPVTDWSASLFFRDKS